MKTVHWLLVMALLVPLAIAVAGCTGSKETTPAGKQYPIKGKVVAVDVSKPSVKLDHEEIPGLMKAMEMDYAVENAKVLEGIKAGDQVEGHLRADSGRYTITQLQKR